MQRIDSEQWMNEVIRSVGGQRICELVGANPSFDNADYLFLNDDVVAELKTLHKDFLSDPAVSDRMHEMYNRWLNEGKDVLIMYGEGVLRTSITSRVCARTYRYL
jgi:hypothetical protein